MAPVHSSPAQLTCFLLLLLLAGVSVSDYCSGYWDDYNTYQFGFLCDSYCCGSDTDKYCCSIDPDGIDDLFNSDWNNLNEDIGDTAEHITKIIIGVVCGIIGLIVLIVIIAVVACVCCISSSSSPSSRTVVHNQVAQSPQAAVVSYNAAPVASPVYMQTGPPPMYGQPPPMYGQPAYGFQPDQTQPAPINDPAYPPPTSCPV
uniref:Protein shisa-5-like n=1 Tax=Saccoglossus kowalevskii TaxID=10224 RepID=A0ABM0GJM9_SACKO|nr:PREDICTED: protein shisa-5-like [Saccoglossus kowalevskii]